MAHITDRRIGKFSISEDLLATEPDLVKGLMGTCLILKADFEFSTKSFEYTAINDDFDEVPDGLVAPNYDIEAEQVGDDITLTWKRIN